MKRKLILTVVVLMAASLYALEPNFNINAGRRLARFAIQKVDGDGNPDPNGLPRYTLKQLAEQATAQIAINKMGVTDPNVQVAVVAGWDEIQAEAVRVYRRVYPTEDEITNAEILAVIRQKYPNATVTKVVGDDKWIVDKDGVE